MRSGIVPGLETRPEGPLDEDRLTGMPLGFAALAVERDGGADVSAAATALSRAVAAAWATRGASSPRAALGAVAEAVALACPTVVGSTGTALLSEALRDGACDCDVLTVAYLTVADALGLPLSAVFLPGHALVVWDDGDGRVYWETMVPEERPAWYVQARVPEGAGAYLRPQSRREMVGYLYHVRASNRMDRGAEAEALSDFDRAIELSPSLVVAHANRGRAHLLAGQYAEALADYDRTLALDPTVGDAAYGRGLALIALGRPSDALGAFARTTALDGPAADVLHAEGLAYGLLGEDDAALERFDAALALDPGLAVAYEARGALRERRGDVAGARQDYAVFVRAATGAPATRWVPEVRRRVGRLGTPSPAS